MDKYKKKYNDALERAKMSYHSGAYDKDTLEMLEIIFPELKESDNEKIKEDLIQWINEFPDTIWRGHYKKDVIAWLEKQREQKSATKVKPNSAWSEEDEIGWTNTMIMIKEVASHHYTKDSIKLVIDWLESLRQRIGG